LLVLLRGQPGASISIEATEEAPNLPPEVTFSANPPSMPLGQSSTLRWTTTNADSVTIDQGIGQVALSGSVYVSPADTTTYTLTAVGPGGTTTKTVTITVNLPPTVTISADPATIQIGESSALSWNSTHADSCEIDEGIGPVEVTGSVTVSPTETTTYTITAQGPGGTATASVTVTVIPATPTVSISANPETIQIGGVSTLSWTSFNADKAYIDNGIGVVLVSGSTTVSPEHTTTYTITVNGPLDSASAQAAVKVTGSPAPQPEGSFGEQYQDLIPQDATVESYDPRRFSLITGLVHSAEGYPIANVSITIQSNPEYGTVKTDENGRFTIPMEGGATFTLVYQKEGLITAHRKVYVPWNDIAIAKTIRMISEDTISTTVSFDGNPETVVTHQSTEVTDAFGTRSCAMVFTGDNTAYLVDDKGNDVHELTTITTRATEFTTPDSMPAILPPNSAYTYCVELSVDGAKRVRFDNPVITWVDNFLGFDVGEAVPVGYYDRDRGFWVPSDNGIVVKLLDTDNDGLVDTLDADGDDQPDDLNGDGYYSDEVTGLEDPSVYPPNATFWRVAVTHFSPWDCNWPFGPPADAIPPNPEGLPEPNQKKDEQKDCQTNTSSFVEVRSRILHEDIAIPGTDMTLHYASNRVEGNPTHITVPASGETIPDSLKRIVVKLEVAGRSFEQKLDPLPNHKAEFVWSGRDHLGRLVTSPTTAHVSLGFVYDAVYYSAEVFEQAFAQAGVEVTRIVARQEVTSWKRSDIFVRRMARAKIGVIAEGWTLSTHHYLNPIDPLTLHKGDGTITENNVMIIDTVAGNGTLGYSGDGGPATEAQLDFPIDSAVDASGDLYICDSGNDRVRKVDASGTINTVVQVGSPTGIAIDAAGNLYISSLNEHQILKVDTSGIITTVAGNGTSGYSGDGGAASEAELNSPFGLALDSSGNLYIADRDNRRIRKVAASGIITTVAGGGNPSDGLGDNGPATKARLSGPWDVAVDCDGNIYIADTGYNRIRKVNTAGIITTVAGNGTYGYSGDGGPASEAEIKRPYGIAVDALGNVYFTSIEGVRRVGSQGIVTTVAGDGIGGYSGDGGPAAEAKIIAVYGLSIDKSNNLYVSDFWTRIRKVGPLSAFSSSMTAGDIPFAEENGFGYIISSAGRHKRTIDLDTGVTLYEFGYDGQNQPVSIADRFGNQTLMQRDAEGVPTAVISPEGITTTLIIDANNHLTRITYPDGAYYSFEYTSDGLMTAKIEPEGNCFDHVFDSKGRLTDATDEEGGHWHFSRIAHENGDILTEVLTGEGNLTSYLDHTYSTGAYTSTITDPTGAETLFAQSADGLIVNKSLPCGMKLAFQYGLDSEYKFKHVKEMSETTLSSLVKTVQKEKIYQDTNTDDIPDLITESVSVNGNPTTLVHNVLQSQKTITSPEGRTVTTLYDPATLLTTSLTIPGLYDTTYGYDTRGRLTSIVTNTRETTFVYDAQGFLESITDPEDYTTTYTYDPVGRMTGINGPDDTSIGFTYDGNGNMTVLTNPSTINHTFGYNLVNRNDFYQTPQSGSYSYVYDKDRRLIQINFPSGNQINNIYDKTRLMQLQTPEGNIDFSYLCGTKVGSVTNGADTVAYIYDGRLLTSEVLKGTLDQTLAYTYDNDFNLTSFTYAGDTHLYTYDDDGLLTGAGSFTIFRNTGNGLPEAVTDGSLNLTRTFNGYGEVQAQEFTIGGQSFSSWNLIRDRNGRIIEKIETVDGTTSKYAYAYDPMGRLRSVTKDTTLVEEYEYGPNGTRTYEMNTLRGISERNFAYSDEDHLLIAGDSVYQYDRDGFLTTKTQDTDVTTYAYSSRGELLSVNLPDGKIIEYIHDPLVRRIAKKVDGIITEKYLWQGLTRLVAVYDGSDNLLMRFEYADSRMPVSMSKGGSTYYLTYDQVGSLRVVADATGTVVKAIDYDSFGNIIYDTNPLFSIPFGFAGGLYDRDTGLVRFGFRDYDPDVGRWTAKDPILFAGGDTDLYGYCLNDPVNFADRWGLLFEKSDFVSVSIAVITTTAKVGGLIVAGTAQAIGAVATVATVFIPSELAAEDQILEHYRTMEELKELNKRIEDMQRKLEPILDLLNIEYDWDNDNPC